MIRFLLDTNICIYIIKKKPIEVLRRLRQYDVSEIAISSITLSELEYGISKSAKPAQNKLALANFIAPLEVMSYDDVAAGIYGPIRAGLEKQGNTIGPLDTLIAAHALALNCTLVTNNIAEFSRVNGLKVENWGE